MAHSNERYSGGRMVLHYADLAACMAAVALSAWAYASLPGGDPVRLLLVSPILLFVPGYLLIEAFRTIREPLGRRVPVVAVAPGLSLAFVAMLALVNAWFPSGFSPNAIVAMVTLVCVGLTAAAGYRRARILMTDWGAPSRKRTSLWLRRKQPRATSPSPSQSPPSPPRPTGLPPAAIPRSLQPVRPGTPVAMQRPANETSRPAAAAPNAGGDLRDQATPPQRTYPRIVQTGR